MTASSVSLLTRYGMMTLILFMTALFVSGCNSSQTDDAFEVVYSNDLKSGAADQSKENTVESKKYKIAVVSKISGIPYFNLADDGAAEAAKDLGVEVITAGPQVADAEHQIEVVEKLIQQGVDAIAIAANNPKALAPVMQKAKQQGIEVITWDSDSVPEARTFFVNQVDAETLGRHMMDLLASYMDERGPFAIMTGSASAMNLNEWIKWIKVQREEYYPNMELVDIVANDESPQKAYTLALELFKQHPNLKGAIGVASISPPALAKAAQDQGKTGEFVVIGVSSPDIMRTYMMNGIAPVVTLWSPKKLGYLTVYLAKQLLDGKMPYDGQDIPNVGNILLKKDIVIMGEPLDFTKENVDEYDF